MTLKKMTLEYECGTEKEAQDLIDKDKASADYSLIKFSSTRKDVKEKGEVIDTYYKVQLVRNMDIGDN